MENNKKIMIIGGIILGVALIPIGLGFGTIGISAGSVAAGIQSSIGAVKAGSFFATMTSFGMKGIFAKFATFGAGFFGFGFFKDRFNFWRKK